MTIPKFRAWTEEGKVMYYDVYPFKDDTLLLSYDEISFDEVPASDFILMQSTGLFDMYDKEIFEGDVLKTSDGELAKVVWNKELACWEAEFLSEIVDLSEVADVKSNRSDCEIVGNIYENPEFLEEK
ncbi:hypothetical protein KJR06_04860 [Streptococcus lutetiensis]|uniref:YopX family protein n=1 Tax=Streptococcus lutetiensis TaxID=150055 RepID=UPI00117C792E|nr:YopX family protein [Streptococcus lutetiensis]HEP3614001.1 hypothetical protein [Streptococcus pyogenes]MBD8956113.1 hypothetical protein [Streptococcus lutetiensis]MBT0905717.1 hypothetical protein [Streptococcus lutetiensis]MBT0947634.1 hypothetical protein [Streptococcus lutetiensis]HEP5544973.1 hypothetical protein [Streptococcus pyogenes]